MDSTIKDPEQATRMLQVDVIGTLPDVKKTQMLEFSERLQRRYRTRPCSGEPTRIEPARIRNAASYEEAVRNFRNSILLSDLDRRMRSILITSASPSEGKSTTAAHLAVAHAEQGKADAVDRRRLTAPFPTQAL